MDDALDSDGLLSAHRELQRRVSMLVPLLLRGKSLHCVLAAESDDKGQLHSLQKVHSSEALAPRAGNR